VHILLAGVSAAEVTYGTLCDSQSPCSPEVSEGTRRHTWHDIARIHRIFVLDETEAVHELDLGDFTSAMGGEVAFNVGFCG
jgi:hypothetical protein